MLSLIVFALAGSLLGDFDQDGREDRAFLRRAGGAYELVVQRGSGETTVLDRLDNPATLYFDVLPPGTYKTACAKGHGNASTCKQHTIRLARPAIQFGTREASQAAVVWEDGHFQTYWLSD